MKQVSCIFNFISQLVLLLCHINVVGQNAERYLSSNSNGHQLFILTTEGEYRCVLKNDRILEVSFQCKECPMVDTSVSVVLPDRNMSWRIVKDREFVNEDWRMMIRQQPFGMVFTYRGRPAGIFSGYFSSQDSNRGFCFDIEDEEFITGGGMRALPLNMKGRILKLENKPWYGYGFEADQLNYSVPLLITGSGYAIFFDNTAKGFADIGKTHTNILRFGSRGGRMAFYVVVGENIQEIAQNFSLLTGRQPLPPLWAFGHLMSRMAYRTQAQTDSIVRATIQNGYPLDAIILDLFWFGDSLFHTLGNLDWYRPNWPDPVQMMNSFREMGVKTVVITEPYIVKGSHTFEEADRLGILGKNKEGRTFILDKFYFGEGGIIDITSPKAREWMWKKYDTLKKQGVAGWWVDLAEPEYHPDGIIYHGGTSELLHNAYGHLWDKMLYDYYRKYYPHERLFNLNRSGFAGSQRFGVLPWTGDVGRSWAGLKAQIPILLNMSMCGVAYVHSDAGGFAQGVKDEELYIRWMQMSTFSPILRPHGSGIPSEPIFFSPETQKIVKDFIRLRYSFLPYNYSLAYQNSTQGIPMARPVFYQQKQPENDLQTWSYFWGPSLLVSPVVEKNEQKHTLWLPKGKWYNWWTGEVYKGARKIKIQNHIQELPLFARGGSFIPMIHPIQNTDEYATDTLIIHYFLAHQPHQENFTLFVDDGKDALSIDSSHFELIHLLSNEKKHALAIQLVSENHGFDKKPQKRYIKMMIHTDTSMPLSFKQKEKKEEIEILRISPFLYQVTFDWEGRSFSLDISW